MGGCIENREMVSVVRAVSSLYGRVYRISHNRYYPTSCFLPVWEGVSPVPKNETLKKLFPPCMGGCIDMHEPMVEIIEVSSLYGRVYR